jgi:hypothetical protein
MLQMRTWGNPTLRSFVLDQANQITQMKWLLLSLLLTSQIVCDAELIGYMIGAPTKNCVASYEVKDNDCRVEVLSKERVRKK